MKKLLLTGFIAGLCPPAFSALPPLSPGELENAAEVTITGEVLASRVLVHRKPSASIYLVRLSVLVKSVEKGEAILKGERTLDVRCWKMRKSNLVGPGGHSDIPADGSSFRMWLRKNSDKQWEPLEPNGIELLNDSPPITFAAVENRESGRGFLIGGIAGLLGLAVFFWFQTARKARST
ncbi:MAG: hypothetical protein P1U68_13225 [Verrucomicrobiales bacterium]|nr:hypothetical protein [Verrucomicrobiales bacterium]